MLTVQTDPVLYLNFVTVNSNLVQFGKLEWNLHNPVIHIQEQLFVSKRSVFDGKKAIRGGVPFVFPIFGPSAVMPQHGFARISRSALAIFRGSRSLIVIANSPLK